MERVLLNALLGNGGEEIDFSNKTKESNTKDRCIKLVHNVRGGQVYYFINSGTKNSRAIRNDKCPGPLYAHFR